MIFTDFLNVDKISIFFYQISVFTKFYNLELKRNFKFTCFVNNLEPNMLHGDEIFAEITTSANSDSGEVFAQFMTLGSEDCQCCKSIHSLFLSYQGQIWRQIRPEQLRLKCKYKYKRQKTDTNTKDKSQQSDMSDHTPQTLIALAFALPQILISTIHSYALLLHCIKASLYNYAPWSKCSLNGGGWNVTYFTGISALLKR